MSKEIKANKKIQHAIRMLYWHTDLARKNYKIVQNWLDLNKLDYDQDLMSYVEKNQKKENDNQLTIFDFL